MANLHVKLMLGALWWGVDALSVSIHSLFRSFSFPLKLWVEVVIDWWITQIMCIFTLTIFKSFLPVFLRYGSDIHFCILLTILSFKKVKFICFRNKKTDKTFGSMKKKNQQDEKEVEVIEIMRCFLFKYFAIIYKYWIWIMLIKAKYRNNVHIISDYILVGL